MAAVADVQLVNISINDVELQVPKGELAVEAIKRLGLEVPIFCYHPRMQPVGMCRMCLIEIAYKMPDGSVRKMPKPQTACTLPCTEGLIIYTDTQVVHTDRRGVLEFLLINHPLDCPICDRGGECPLQNNTLFYGPSTSRYVEMKRHAPKAYPLSQYVTLDLERCIQCGRCVRFTEEISGDAQLALRFRGARTQPGTFELLNFDSKFSGNVIEICPVGALTNRKYRFRARPWDLQTRPGICTLCSNGCNIYVDYRTNEIVRINGRTNEAVNEEWTCDRGKFGHYALNTEGRLDKVFVRKRDQLVPGDWADAYEQIQSAFGANSAILTGGALSNEDYYAVGKLSKKLGTPNVDHRWGHDLLGTTPAPVENAIADFENAKRILVFGTSLADDLPILYLRVRKAWFKNAAKVIVAHDRPTDVDSFAHLVLRYRPGTGAVLAEALTLGSTLTAEAVEEKTGVAAAIVAEARTILAEGAAVATCRTNLGYLPDGSAVLNALTGLSAAIGGTFSAYTATANGEGAALLGVVPTTGGKNTRGILQGCVDGSIEALWLVGADPFALEPDRALVKDALETVPFLVYQHHTESEAMHYASVVLPMTAPTEAEGSYTNMERRVQTMGAILPARGSAKPAWRALTELSMRIQPETPKFHPHDVLDAIAAEVPAYEGASYAAAKGEGLLLG